MSWNLLRTLQLKFDFRVFLKVRQILAPYLNHLMLDDPPIDRSLIEDSPPEVEAPPLQPPNRLSLEPSIVNPWRHLKITSRRPYRTEAFDHAAPLSPLRDRDVKIMAGWFDRVDMTEVEQDIDYHLSMLYPEPPWEEELDLNFLKDHL